MTGNGDASDKSGHSKVYRPVRAAHIGESNISGEMVLHSREHDITFPLNPTARAVWELCDGEHTVADIGKKLAKRFGCSEPALLSELLSEVKLTIFQLRLLGALESEKALHIDDSQYPEWYASDNGFDSRLAMDRAHKPVVELAVATLAGHGGNILDLGCGNGVLLKKIHEANPKTIPFGIEIDPGRVEHALVMLPEFAGNFISGNIFENESIWPDGRRYALAILAPRRLLEVEPEQAGKLIKQLKRHCDSILVHAYYRNGLSLEERVRKVGMLLLDSKNTKAAEIGLAIIR